METACVTEWGSVLCVSFTSYDISELQWDVHIRGRRRCALRIVTWSRQGIVCKRSCIMLWYPCAESNSQGTEGLKATVWNKDLKAYG